MMSDKWKEYVNDPRTICKYGSKCYQQNPQHHVTFKHPPRNLKHNREKRTRQRFNPYLRDARNATDNHKNTDQETNRTDERNTPESDSNLNFNQDQQVALKEPESKPNQKVDNELETASNNKDLEHKKAYCAITLQENITFHDPSADPTVLKELFLVEMPPDFYKLYDCLNSNNDLEKTLASVNLEAIGPYDLLLGKLPKLNVKELYLTYWRFFYDPPEFQAVLKKKGKSEYHIGYFRDDPNEKPVFLASNDCSKDCHIAPIAENIFGALYSYLQNEKKHSPFTGMTCQRLMDKIKKYADENNYSLEEYNVKKRLSSIVCKTFHGAGIVVPYNKKTQLGYRRLVETDANIKKLFQKLQTAKTESEKDQILSDIQPIVTYASIAVDECDFGTGIEAGIAMFCSGLKELEPSALSSLTAAYSLLQREAFSTIIQAHLKNRRRGPNLSILSMKESSASK